MNIYGKLLLFMAIVAAGCVFSAHQAHAGGGPTYAVPSIDGAAYTTKNTPKHQNSATSKTSPGTSHSGVGTTAVPSVVADIPVSGLYKVSGNPTVYAFINGQLHPITSEAAFLAWGFQWKNVQTISFQKFSTMSLGETIGIPDGSLVKSASNSTYLVFGGQKNLVDNSISLQKLGLSSAHTVAIPAADLSAIPLAPPVTPVTP